MRGTREKCQYKDENDTARFVTICCTRRAASLTKSAHRFAL